MAVYVYKKVLREGWPAREVVGGVLSLCFLILGGGLIVMVMVPIISWSILVMPSYPGTIVSPLAAVLEGAGVEVTDGGNVRLVSDSYRPASWFVGAKPTFSGLTASGWYSYVLSIPKLAVENALVTVGGEDLKKSLIAWPTSAKPGNYGVSVVFGHSELPSFSDGKTYRGIFTRLMELSDGDEIYVDYDGVRYKYRVVDKKVVDPTDLSVLEQRFDAAYMSLITCVPPGTLWKRGVVRAKMTQI